MVSIQPIARVAVVTRDEGFGDALAEWFTAHDPELPVVLRASRWGDLLNDAAFPTDLVVLDAASSTRNSIESRVRTLRASGAAVIVIAPRGDEVQQRAVSAGAFCVLEKTVPAGLIGEMARGALGLLRAG